MFSCAYVSGFSVKRAGINPGAPGFVYPFYPHKSMRRTSQPPHLLGKFFYGVHYFLRCTRAHANADTFFYFIFTFYGYIVHSRVQTDHMHMHVDCLGQFRAKMCPLGECNP